MRVLLFLGVAALFALAFADPKQCHPKRHKKGKHHYKKQQQLIYRSWPGHKIAHFNAKFAFDLFRQVALERPSENIVFSPISVSTAFAFLSLGAKGQTHTQIIENLGFNTSLISEKEIHEGFHVLQYRLNDDHRELQLNGGNALFISKEHKILTSFRDEAKRLYNSEASPIDFTNPKEATNQINSYVEKNTHGMIPKLLDTIDKKARLVLINYVYFKAKWQKPFKEILTIQGNFHVNEKTILKVPFMSVLEVYNVAETEDATVLFMPYEGDAEASFILPKEGKLDVVEQNFNTKSFLTWKKLSHKQFLEVSLPRFSGSSTIHFKETLEKLGILDVFSDYADLSGINGEGKIKVSEAIHKSVIRVTEKGTEAATSPGGVIVPYSDFPHIKFDRPFLFLVFDIKAECLIVIGRILNPIA